MQALEDMEADLPERVVVEHLFQVVLLVELALLVCLLFVLLREPKRGLTAQMRYKAGYILEADPDDTNF